MKIFTSILFEKRENCFNCRFSNWNRGYRDRCTEHRISDNLEIKEVVKSKFVSEFSMNITITDIRSKEIGFNGNLIAK
jgi:hypothetical protein